MNINKIVWLLIVLTILSFAIGGLILKSNIQTYEINEEKTLSMENITLVQIETVGADVNIMPSDSGEIKAVLHGTVKTYGSNFVKLLADKKGQNIKIETKQLPRFFPFDERESLYLDIYIPKNYEHELVLNEVSGDTKIKDMKLKSLNFATVSGDFSGDNISAEMKLESLSGDLNLGKSKGKVSAETVSGKINIEYVSFENLITAETVSGHITLKLPKESCFDLNFDTVSGIQKTDFSLKANDSFKNSKGQINGFYCNGGNTTLAGKIDVETVSGNLELIEINLNR